MGWFRGTQVERQETATTFEARLAQIGPGVPGHCPACDGLGYIDNIDIGHRYQIQHCKDCQHRWEYLFDGDGRVVGLTELDVDGHPVTRSRIRADRAVPTLPTEPPALDVGDREPDVVLDLRDEAVPATPVLDLTEPEPAELSPAAWLRRSLGR